MKQCLVLIDIQNDYFKGGKYELVNPEQAAMQAIKVLTRFREWGWPVVHVCHLSIQPRAAFFIPDTEGSEIYREIRPLETEDVIIKHRPDSFLDTTLKAKLEEKGINQLVVCGMMTHMCIDTTVRAAVGHGYDVTLIEDACATRDLEWHGNIISAEQVQNVYLASLAGMFARVVKADTWISENNM